MGADLTIGSVHNELAKKYQPLFSEYVKKRDSAKTPEERNRYQKKVSKYYDLMYSAGYFRDSYNNTSVFWQMGLSWWKHVGDMLNKHGDLSVKNTKKLIEMIKEREIPKELKLDANCFDNKDNTPAKWRNFFIKKRKKLIDFLQTAVDNNEPVHCSV